MATEQLPLPDDVSDKLLGRIAHKVYPQHLERFAVNLLEVEEDAKYYHIVDGAGDNPWLRCFYVLRSWNKKQKRTLDDLCVLLREAERLGFVQNGAREDLITGKVWHTSYLEKCHTGPFPNFARVVAPWYTDPVWQNMLLFPWMDEEALLLSEVYTQMEMEEHRGRDMRKVAIPLNDYKDIFTNLKAEGNRILVKGDPGIGKTTFVQKLAFDWANCELEFFDVVLVVKLKFASNDQSVASMIKTQIKTVFEDDTVSEDIIADNLKSGRERVLLVLDGLDEINLKRFPQVQEILTGDAYRKCCILTTTRPYVAETLYNKMTIVAKINGFSRQQAEKFVGNMLDPEECRGFLRHLDRRKMSEMHKVPLIVQALALLYREKHELPQTYTITYDQLVFFLRNSCKKSKDLNEEELLTAMEEVNELAFKGLTREDRQLVFSRDEVKNQNTYKLGLLTAEKTGSGYNPVEVLQFPHKTIQEHSAAAHVVKRLLDDDRGPWEMIVEQFHKEAERDNGAAVEKKLASTFSTQPPPIKTVEALTETTKVRNALKKLTHAILSYPNAHIEAEKFVQKLVDVGAFDEEIDFPRISDFMHSFLRNHPLLGKVLTEEDVTAIINYTIKDLLMETPKEWRAGEKRWLNILLRQRETDKEAFLKYFLDYKVILSWLAANPQMAKQTVLQQLYAARKIEPDWHYREPYRAITQDLSQLMDRVEYSKTLFRFIMGKLSQHSEVREKILAEIATLVVQHSFDKGNGGVLPFNDILSCVIDVKTESHPDGYEEPDLSTVSPVLVYIGSSVPKTKRQQLTSDTPCALRVLGKDAKIPEMLTNVSEYIEQLRHIRLVELDYVHGWKENLSETYEAFKNTLYQSPTIMSIELSNVDPDLVKILTSNLPRSVQRLSIDTASKTRAPRGSYTFPEEVSLICLYLDNCLSKIGSIFSNTRFPKLVKLSVRDDNYKWEREETLTWETEDVKSLSNAIQGGRMPILEELLIRDSCLQGCGAELTEILRHETLSIAELTGVQLSSTDGDLLLANIKQGHLDHLESLDLLSNEDLGPVTHQLKAACRDHGITLDISSPPGQPGFDVAALVSNFFPQQKSEDSSAERSEDVSQASGTSIDFGGILSALTENPSTLQQLFPSLVSGTNQQETEESPTDKFGLEAHQNDNYADIDLD